MVMESFILKSAAELLALLTVHEDHGILNIFKSIIMQLNIVTDSNNAVPKTFPSNKAE